MRTPRRPAGPSGLGLIPAGVSAARYLPGLFQQVARRYGDVACISIGPSRIYLLSSPELAQDVLVRHDRRFEKGRGERRLTQRLLGRGVLGSEGAFHRRQHKLLWPHLRGTALERHARIAVEHAIRMQEGWTDGRGFDAYELLNATNRAIMIESMFGAGVDTPSGRDLETLLTEAIDALERLPLPVLPGTDKLPLPANRRFERALALLDERLLSMVAERRTGDLGGDLLADLAHAGLPDGERMDDRLVRDEALSIFRGNKTTGTTLAWTWYLLARHPQVEARVFEEVDSVLGDALPTASDLERLPVCRMVVNECLRLFPPAWMLARRAVAEHEAGDHVVPPGATVITSPYVVHRDERVHREPRRFDPERFEPARQAAWHPFAFFPFGGGPKMCLGDEFAPAEAVLLLATIARRWRLRPAPGHLVEPEPKATLKLRHGLQVVLERRT